MQQKKCCDQEIEMHKQKQRMSRILGHIIIVPQLIKIHMHTYTI